MSHDGASCLSGEINGLSPLLKSQTDHFFWDIIDPCHCLNLAAKHSFEALPPDILRFVTDVHVYFNYPQRKHKLRTLQKEKGFEQLYLKQLNDTRWLSLGESLERMLRLWPAILAYFKDELKEAKLKKEQLRLKGFISFMENEISIYQLELLSHILTLINNANKNLQDIHFESCKMNQQFKSLFNSIFVLFLKNLN